ncbi:MAG: ubiquitin-conjugating enzyme E2 [Burkholderiaceae bacterium]
MSGLASRRQADLERVRRLVQGSRGELELLPGSGESRLHVRVHRPTAADRHYPRNVLPGFELVIDLPARYPFEPPTVRLGSARVFHPNVFESGVVCVGSRWQSGEGLDLYLMRVVRLLLFDGMLVNLQSVAHDAAGRWYARARREHPDAFPTATIDWRGETDRIVRECPHCHARLRLPAARQGWVDCPRCGQPFEART